MSEYRFTKQVEHFFLIDPWALEYTVHFLMTFRTQTKFIDVFFLTILRLEKLVKNRIDTTITTKKKKKLY